MSVRLRLYSAGCKASIVWQGMQLQPVQQSWQQQWLWQDRVVSCLGDAKDTCYVCGGKNLINR